MIERIYTEYSNCLSREMTFKVYGETGKICYVIPSQDGRYFDYENFQMVEVLKGFIESGKITLVCADSIDKESWSAFDKDKHERACMQEKFFNYVTTELYPSVAQKLNNYGKAIITGCSMGAIHSAIFFFRRPDLFDGMIALSGAYDATHFFGDYMDEVLYQNSVMNFLCNMPNDHEYIQKYNQSKIIVCVGQGAWEDELLESTRALDRLLKEKGIDAWVDYWGFDVNHDWVWWRKQIVYFMDKIL